MKKILYFTLLVSLLVFVPSHFSSAQVKDSVIDSGGNVKVLPENGVCPDNYVLNQGGNECVKPSTLPSIPVVPNDGSKDPTDGGNTVVTPVNGVCPDDFILNENGTECLKPSPKTPIAPLQGSKETVGTSFFLAPINGECPENHIISDDGKSCIKLDIKVPIAPLEGIKEQVGVSSAPPTPVNGECPDGFAISPDGKECSKILPKIIIAPREGFKEIIFEAGGKTTVKDNNAKKEAVVSSKIGVVASIKPEGKQAREITLEPNIDSGDTKIIAENTYALTKEAVKIENNKIFLEQKEVIIMPNEAKNVAVASEKLSSVLATELKTEEQKPTYSVQGTKSAKLLFFIPVGVKITAKIDATNGSVISTQKPWWGFLTR